jgi:radical SAM protein with 4Fe4S-binding SPASM domain
MGNLFRDELRAILATDYAKRWERALPEHCDGCEQWAACVGGCRAASEQLGYSMTEVDPIAWQSPP